MSLKNTAKKTWRGWKTPAMWIRVKTQSPLELCHKIWQAYFDGICLSHLASNLCLNAPVLGRSSIPSFWQYLHCALLPTRWKTFKNFASGFLYLPGVLATLQHDLLPLISAAQYKISEGKY